MLTEYDILRDHLSNKGLKRTQQRFDILDAFMGSIGHITAYDLHTILKKRRLNIGFSTVYRTLKLLTECGIAHEVNFGDGVARFAKAFKRETHGHLVCTKCGNAVEFETLPFDKTKTQIAAKNGYIARSFRFEIYGLCRKCRK